ncbi:hypothetical protein [Roseisalinus antarcticus]|uniref:Uncharacterized protein n=1 Tax=Roseisalinus antarcticus TaxID=254357 RepID=A0A1Y5SI35_9RHOB|nr:hypothetical protein [Roseisalinus antarcticus]SLN41208.1 hypothetical protein ROA7023_01637 [Roseisalinus antarcticus]
MRTWALCVGFALMSGAASGQDFGPDGTRMDLRHIAGDRAVVSDLQGTSYVCEFRIDNAAAVITGCAPLRHVSRAALAAAAEEREALIVALSNLPPMVATVAVSGALRDMGCALRLGDMDDQELLTLLTVAAAPHLGFDPAIVDEEIVEAVRPAIDEAGDILVDQGRLVINERLKVATLTDCP